MPPEAPERILGSIRLSDWKDETTSPERQEEIVTASASARSGTIVGWARDIDVSASKVHPFERPELGKWLKTPDEFDTLLFWKLDRFVRSVSDFHDMIKWCDQHGKNLVSATEPIDLSTDIGRAIAYLIAIFAGMEAKAIADRVRGSHDYLRRHGRWGGGSIPYGFMPAENPEGAGWVLVHDPDTAPIVREMVDRIIAGESMNSICIDFNKRGVLSPRDHLASRSGKREPKGHKWATTGFGKIMRGRALLGVAEYEGQLIRDDSGLPVQRAEPLITRAKWLELQTAMKSLSITKTRTSGASLLLKIAFCPCGKPLYRRQFDKKGRTYAYYFCPEFNKGECTNTSIQQQWLESLVESMFLTEIGDLEVLEKRLIPGEDHSKELAEVEQALEELEDDRAAGLYSSQRGTERFRAMHMRLSERYEALAALPQRPDRWETVPTDRTMREEWFSLDTVEARRAFLLGTEIRVTATPEDVQMEIPANLRERIRERTARVRK